MVPLTTASLRPIRLLGLMTPLVVMAGLVVLLLLPNLVMHTGLRSHASAYAARQRRGLAERRSSRGVTARHALGLYTSHGKLFLVEIRRGSQNQDLGA